VFSTESAAKGTEINAATELFSGKIASMFLQDEIRDKYDALDDDLTISYGVCRGEKLRSYTRAKAESWNLDNIRVY
jgi:hypothetical protein